MVEAARWTDVTCGRKKDKIYEDDSEIEQGTGEPVKMGFRTCLYVHPWNTWLRREDV